MKLDRLKAELEKARQKAAEWQARIKDIERQITEQENNTFNISWPIGLSGKRQIS